MSGKKSCVTCSTLSWAMVHGHFLELDFGDFIPNQLEKKKKKKSNLSADGNAIKQKCYFMSVILLELELTTIALMFRA